MRGEKRIGQIFLYSIILWVLGAGPVFAHGDHGDAAPPAGGINQIHFEGFQLELLTSPNPLRAASEGKIVIKILRDGADGSVEPVRNGKVSIGVVPVQFHNNHSLSRANLSGAPQPQPRPFSLVPSPEVVWAGSYTLLRRLDQKGPHLVRVAISQLDGKLFSPPAVIDFHLSVAPAAGLPFGFMVAAVMALAIGTAGTAWAVARSHRPLGLPVNLLSIHWLHRFVHWKGFQPIFQIPLLLLTAVIVFLGLFDIQDGAKSLATKLTWILWWPGIIITFILVGRLWCVMCPFGTLNEWTARLVKPGRSFPRVLRNLWLATLAFVLLTWADEQLGVIRSPQMTAWLIIILGALSVGVGLFYQRRSFCRYLCPITGLQALYAMVSPIELRADDRSRCGKDCHQDCYRGSVDGTGCPMFEFPMTMERNAYCNFCFECVKSCPPDNLALRFRAFGKDLWASKRRWLDESYLAVAMVGLSTVVTAQMLSGWSDWIAGLSRLIPVDVRVLMKPVTYLALTESALFFFFALLLVPLIVLVAAWVCDRLAGPEGKGVRKTAVVLGYMFIPVGLAMHLAHNVSHLFIEGPGVIPALQRAINLYTPFGGGEPNWQTSPLVSADVVYWLEMSLVLGGLLFSLVVGYRLIGGLIERRESAGRAFVPLVAVSLLFTLVNLYLLNQPMGMRHGM